jgi:hypothetical protein
MPPKKVPSKAVGGPGGSGIEAMTIAQLKYLAKTKKISLTGITKKADIIQALSGKEKLKKSPQKTKKVPTTKKSPTKKMTSPKGLKWAVLERDKEGVDFFGLYATKEEALYAIYLERSESGEEAEEMLAQFFDEEFIGDRSGAYHVVEVGDLIRKQSPHSGDLSLSDFKKLIKKVEGGHEEKPRFVGKAKGKAKAKTSVNSPEWITKEEHDKMVASSSRYGFTGFSKK